MNTFCEYMEPIDPEDLYLTEITESPVEMEWRHTVIEIYPLERSYPSEGCPADWIRDDLVLWCQGDDETVIYFAPWNLIFEIKWARLLDTLDEYWYLLLSKIPGVQERWEREWAEIMADLGIEMVDCNDD